MHPSAYRAGQRFRDKYVQPGWRVLDVGSYDVNGTLKPLFTDCDYTGLDIEAGPNVDVVMEGRTFPFADNSFDVSVSTSCFEHDPAFWVTFAEMVRVTRRYIYLNAPSAGGYHAYPIDCWRFLKDSWQALADWAGVELIEQWQENERPGFDQVGVFRC